MPASRRYRIVVSRRRKNPGALVPWLRIATLASFAAICIGSNALVIAHGFSTPGFVYSLGLAAAASLIATVALVHWPMAAMAGAEEKARNGSLNGYSPSTAGNQSP